MTILVKIKQGQEIYDKVESALVKVGTISYFEIEGEQYILMMPFQAAALQELGVILETYKSSRTLFSQVPIVPKGTQVEEVKFTPSAEGPEFDQFIADLEEILA